MILSLFGSGLFLFGFFLYDSKAYLPKFFRMTLLLADIN